VDGCFNLVVNAVDVEGEVHGKVLCRQVDKYTGKQAAIYSSRFFNSRK
jgi:hypothetical protein